jgi:hypothetical protein
LRKPLERSMAVGETERRLSTAALPRLAAADAARAPARAPGAVAGGGASAPAAGTGACCIGITVVIEAGSSSG